MKAKQKLSLEQKVFHLSLLSCLILGMTTSVIGLFLYYTSLSGQQVKLAQNIASQVYASSTDGINAAAFAEEVMDIYNGLSETERMAEDYQDNYKFQEERTAAYRMLTKTLSDYFKYTEVSAVYIAMFDAEHDRIIYIVDPDQDDPRRVGQFEKVPHKAITTFMTENVSDQAFYMDRTRASGWHCTTGIPLRLTDDHVSGFVLVDVSMANVGTSLRGFAFGTLLAVFFLTAGIALYLTHRMNRTLVEPINSIARAARSFVKDRKEGIDNKEHFASLDIQTGDEVENLKMVMADMERDLWEIEEDLTNVTAENERIGIELDLARRIQADMLPNEFPPFPNRTDLNIFASMKPAKEVGGDFYDFFLIDNDHLAMVIADVSGKGVPAALFMMVSKILVQNYSMMGVTPKDVLERVNQQICQNNREEMFITVWLGILDLKNGHMTCANAGHEYPILMQPDSNFEIVKDRHGFVIGGLDNTKYSNYELKLEKGAKLFVYTDGVPEATAHDGELYGMDRLVEALNEVREEKPQQILRAVRKSVNTFVDKMPQFDDLTMLCLEYNGPSHPIKEITEEARIESIPIVTDFVVQELEALDCPPKVQMQIELAIDELFGNISHYAYPGSKGNATVRFEPLDEKNGVMLTFIDSGIAYNPLEAPEPDLSLPVEERQMGGLGIFMVRKTMDEVSYEHVDGCNILHITKLF